MKRILHIDDDENIRILLEDILVDKGYEFVGVSTAEEGLKLVKENHIDLVLLDFKLAGKLQGIDFLKKLKELKIRIKVIPITASPSTIEKEIKDNYSKIVVDFILKPFEPDKLLKKIKKVFK